MSRPSLGKYIRNINYLAAKDSNDRDEDEEDPGNLLIDFERRCDQDDTFSFKELQDGYAAFREKVCIPNFTGRHSPPYWVAYSTACVLERLTSNFEDDEDKQLPIGKEMVYTWLALYCAKPTSGQLDLMSKFTGDMFEKYIQACKVEELVTIMRRMKIQFSYDATKETDEEQTYASFLNDHAVEIFKSFTEEQCAKPGVQEAFLDLRIYFQQQIGKVSTTMAPYIYYLVRDMASNFPDGNPYKNFTNVQAIKSHISAIGESLCTYEGDLKTLQDEDILKEIIKSVRETPMLKTLLPDFMALIIRFSKRQVPLQNGDRIFDLYRLQLFRDFEEYQQPDSGIFDSCVGMVTKILTDGSKLDKSKQGMIDTAISECALKFKDLKQPQVKTMMDLLVVLINTRRLKMFRAAIETLTRKENKKVFEWKDWVKEAKQFLFATRTLPCDQVEDTDDRDFDKVMRGLKDTTEMLLEMFKKGKILNQLLNDHVTFILNCLETAQPHEEDIAQIASDSKYLVISSKDKDLVEEILSKTDKMLKEKDKEWNRDNSVAVHYLLTAVVTSYNGNGKNICDSQNSKFLSIFDTCCQGETLEDKLVHSEDENFMTVYYRIYTCLVIPYINLHVQSKSLTRCIPVVKHILKWAKIAFEENHSDLISISFGVLPLISEGLSPELADITTEVVNLLLSTDKVSELTNLLRSLYALNPEAVHRSLQALIDKLDGLSQNDRSCVAYILGEVAEKHPEQFTEAQIGKLVTLAGEEDQGVQMMLFNLVNNIAAKCPQNVCKQFSKLQKDSAYHSSTLILRVMIIARIAFCDKKFSSGAIDYLVNLVKKSDQKTAQMLFGQMYLLARNDREYMLKYKGEFEKLESDSQTPELKESCRNIINIIEGKSIEGIFEDIQQTQEDISDLDKKVGATMTTVISLGDHVIEQGKDISKVQSDVDNLEERVDVVEEDLADTKVKVEDIDNKTMTNAPKWSRDLTKLLNPSSENDWRLLAKRLGYSNDDIRGWAQQNDPCMALLSEWYATHKTSEATYGLLTHLQEMNRQDGTDIVENAMKATEDVVEDEEFEYPTPPPIFLSYQWGIQNEVKLLKQHLNMAGYECWMDIGQMGGGDKLFNKIDSGIRAAKVIVCCTTEKYAQSHNCNREVNLSVNLGKPIIPLLMEKMAWPPKGSMGPIFSEYLFIRFFQRNGEETNDQRYWPAAKFQELLMQLNFHAVPDPSLIQPVYSSWWTPIAEEIEINKNKSKADSSQKTSVNKAETDEANKDVSPVIFLSYQWGKQPQIKALYDRLVSLGYTVWMDIFQMGGGDSLYDKIDRGMRGCKVVVSCVTNKYALSANCRREVSLADALKKPMIPLLLESMKWPPDGPMSMIFTELLYINVYRDQHVQDNWTGSKFEELKEKLRQHVPDDSQGKHKGLDENKADKTKKTGPVATQSEKEKSKPKSEADTMGSRDASSQKKPEAINKDINGGNQQEQKSVNQTNRQSDMSPNDKQAKSKSCLIL